MANTQTTIKALRILAEDLKSMGSKRSGSRISAAADTIEQLTEQLAKANERVKELESYNVRLANESHEYQQRCAELEKDLLRQSVFMEKTSVKLEQHREWQATASVLRRPTREAKQALKKLVFAQQIEGAFLFAEYLEGIPLVKICSREISSFSDLVGNFEQLRKEQE